MLMGGRHSSVESYAPTVLRPRDLIPSTTYMLFSIFIVQIESIFAIRIGMQLERKYTNWPNLKKTKDVKILRHL